jgi:DUF218 domain
MPNLGMLIEIFFIIILIGMIIGAFVIANLHSFLAKHAPIDADILVVEGWLPDYALKAAMKEFQQGSYRQLVTIGGSIPRGSYLFQYKTFAELAAATLTAMGLETKDLMIAPHNAESASRTYDMATDLKQWLLLTNQEINSLNLMTLGTHSRRSWILFKKSFEPQIAIGIIAIEPCHYNPLKWWHSSEGTRTILSEFIAYMYTRLLSINIL